MPFHVPEEFGGLFDLVESRFRLLIHKGIVSGVLERQFDKWLSNYHSEEDRYLAARLLEALTFRSEPMVASSIAHIVQCILPTEIRRAGVTLSSINELKEWMRTGSARKHLRFVEVSDPKGLQPGKSGPVIMRELHRHGRVHNSLLCFPQDLAQLPASVRCLVFVDDMLGTGRQFTTFADRFGLQRESERRSLLYCPLAAHVDGRSTLATACPWLRVIPVEEFGAKNSFFRSMQNDSRVWGLDGINYVSDVRAHVNALAKAAGFGSRGAYDLNLLVAFHHATPNNSLPLLYANTSKWHYLLIR